MRWRSWFVLGCAIPSVWRSRRSPAVRVWPRSARRPPFTTCTCWWRQRTSWSSWLPSSPHTGNTRSCSSSAHVRPSTTSPESCHTWSLCHRCKLSVCHPNVSMLSFLLRFKHCTVHAKDHRSSDIAGKNWHDPAMISKLPALMFGNSIWLLKFWTVCPINQDWLFKKIFYFSQIILQTSS